MRLNRRARARTACLLGGVLWAAPAFPVAAQELTYFEGATNSIDSPLKLKGESYAWKVEYRQGLGELFEFSYSWLNEGHVTAHHRDGSSLQLWARETIFDRRLSLALGAGAVGAGLYVAVDKRRNTASGGSAETLAGMVTPSVSYRFAEHWHARFSWNRAVTTYDRDTEVRQIGVGYRF